MEYDGCSRRYQRVPPTSHGISPVLAPIHPAIHPQIGVHEITRLSTPSYSPPLRLYHALAALLFTCFLHLYILCGLLHPIHLFARTFASCLSTCPCRTRSHRLRRIRDRCRPETLSPSGSPHNRCADARTWIARREMSGMALPTVPTYPCSHSRRRASRAVRSGRPVTAAGATLSTNGIRAGTG